MKRNRRVDMAYLEKISILFLIGILVAVILGVFYKESFNLLYLEINKRIYQIIENESFKREQYFFVCLSEIVGETLLIWIFSCTVFSKLYNGFFCFKKGFIVGFLFGITIVSYGFKKGIFVLLSYIPHGTVYGIVLIINILISRGCNEEYRKVTQNPWKCILWCLLIIILMVLGVCFESSVHINLLRRFLQENS